MAIKPARWSVQPALVAREAQGLWRGLAFLVPLWGFAGKGALLGANGQPLAGANPVAGSTSQWRGTPYGVGGGITGASNFLSQDNFAPLMTSNGAYTGDLTIACLANPVAEARSVVLASQAVTGAFPGVFIAANGGNTSGRLRMDIGATGVNIEGRVDGRYHLFAGVRAGTLSSVYVDGVVIATQAAAGQAVGSASAGIALGNMAESVNNRIATTTQIVFAADWNRALSDVEMRMLARDPFCMLRPDTEWRGVWTPAGGDAVLSPADFVDSLGFETAGFVQAHQFAPPDAFLAAGFEAPGFLQTHVMTPYAMHSALPFEYASLAMASPGAPQFRTHSPGTSGRRENIIADARSKRIGDSRRSRTITE